SKNIMYRDLKYFIRHVVLTFAIILAVYFISKLYMPVVIAGYLHWAFYATITTIIAIALTLGTDLLLYKEDLFMLIDKLKKNFLRKKNKKDGKAVA
ncbi:MAG: hypothetical protein IJL85_07240, partial [Erysipelotrichaceae bacterium]|nr:hypothetical protein [Erysipelotrichaceae bacterium]